MVDITNNKIRPFFHIKNFKDGCAAAVLKKVKMDKGKSSEYSEGYEFGEELRVRVEGEQFLNRFKLSTKLRAGIKDVQGEIIAQKLNDNNFGISKIKVGQIFYIEITDDQNIEEVAKILVNDILYDYEIENISGDSFNE